jgi:hypothetical protein
MKTFHVVSVSIGTALLLFFLTAFMVGALVLTMLSVHQKPSMSAPTLKPQNGALGEIEHQLNDLKFGPVNTNATKEVKNGWLIDRIRANRQSRVCASSVSRQAVCVSPPTVYYPQTQSIRVVDSSDCNYPHIVANPVVNQTIVTQPSGLEMPAALPIHPLEVKDCAACTSSKDAIKTGAFICSNCRKSQVGEWHTEWKSDGTPITFLCEHCYSLMSPEQREKAYIGYLSRQSKSSGIAGLLHQEIGQ